MHELLIREEEEKDQAVVRAVNSWAFGRTSEADLVDALREQERSAVSLVAEKGGRVVAHIMFSPVSIAGRAHLKLMGLGPMAVAPEHQRHGVGSGLVRAGLEKCKQLGFGAVVVLGHPEYYRRFGFVPSVRFGMSCEYEAPRDAFMAMELEPGFLRDAAGRVKYHEAFSHVS